MYKTEYTHDDRGDDVFEVHCPDGVVLICLSEPADADELVEHLNHPRDGKYSIEGYVENLFDTYYNITAFPIPEQGNSFAVYPAPPRFYGVKVGAKF